MAIAARLSLAIMVPTIKVYKSGLLPRHTQINLHSLVGESQIIIEIILKVLGCLFSNKKSRVFCLEVPDSYIFMILHVPLSFFWGRGHQCYQLKSREWAMHHKFGLYIGLHCTKFITYIYIELYMYIYICCMLKCVCVCVSSECI